MKFENWTIDELLERCIDIDDGSVFMNSDEVAALRRKVAELRSAQPVSQGYKLNSPEIPDGCKWTYDEHDYKWDSACGEAWMFSDGGPIENGVKFCQSCGKPVLLAAAPEGSNGA
ncbi:hypothetical protein [Serratia proteamaculans]|uniref:hypothetical protein n=1 Tax=Serratia proteamaculans TaxID=28151 RepID=UPI0010213B2A|nr:hypothetical protein [Serratia proteamaculans]RYM48748.1 hypothetical protein BSQ97_20910 [Serratia proteamaculans]